MRKKVIFKIFAFTIFILLVTTMIFTFGDKKDNAIEKEDKKGIIKEDIVERNFLAQKYTVFDISDINKVENIRLSSNSINNIILKPGEEFSFNNIVGERTAEKGYKEAKVIYKKPNGESYEGLGIGGGICQVSSTLYMAIKELNLEIIERHSHSLPVSYCSVEDEAMINWGTNDLRFKNNLNEEITIKLYLAPIEGNNSQQKLICEVW